jgi:DNA-binding MarR family transcriptional regulator
MSKSTEVKAIAQEIVKVIPLVMRTIAAEQHRSSYLMWPAHFRLLTMLSNHSCNLSELAVRQAVSLPTMSNSISVLVERGWVKRVPLPDDRRQVMLELTPDGRAVLGEIKDQAEVRVAELLDKLTSDDLKSLSAGIAILEQALAPGMCSKSMGNTNTRVKIKRSRER